jgi:Fe2+ or Zn2+ uptake regulation protein
MARQSRNTKQKELLLNLLNEMETFFSADDLLIKANKKDKKIGIATVYRFLSDLRKNFLVNSYLCNKKMVYSKEKSHCHFICEKTNKTIHFEIDNIDFLKSKIPGKIKSFQLEIRGICDNCK